MCDSFFLFQLTHAYRPYSLVDIFSPGALQQAGFIQHQSGTKDSNRRRSCLQRQVGRGALPDGISTLLCLVRVLSSTQSYVLVTALTKKFLLIFIFHSLIKPEKKKKYNGTIISDKVVGLISKRGYHYCATVTRERLGLTNTKTRVEGKK